MKNKNPFVVLTGVLVLGAFLGACTPNNPLANNTSAYTNNGVSTLAQIEVPDSRPNGSGVGTLIWCSAVGPTPMATPNANLQGAPAVNGVNIKPFNSAKPYGTFQTSPSTNIIVDPSVFSATDCPGGNCYGYIPGRGVGGPKGDFSNDTFVRWTGIKGPDPSAHWSRVEFQIGGGTTTDISKYRGLIFWARGHGNFAVNIDAQNDKASPVTAPNPYADYNLYLKRFGAELNGDQEWKQIIVYFDDMVQEWGLAANRAVVLKNARMFFFTQETPVDRDFLLDLDYIRLF